MCCKLWEGTSIFDLCITNTYNIVTVREAKIEKIRHMAGKSDTVVPIVSKLYCSSSQVVLVVRRRPHVVNGGGFVVTDCSQKVVFRVDGCGILGTKEELVLRDGDGEPLLLIRRKVMIILYKYFMYMHLILSSKNLLL